MTRPCDQRRRRDLLHVVLAQITNPDHQNPKKTGALWVGEKDIKKPVREGPVHRGCVGKDYRSAPGSSSSCRPMFRCIWSMISIESFSA